MEVLSNYSQTLWIGMNPRSPGILDIEATNEYGTAKLRTEIKIGDKEEKIVAFNEVFNVHSQRNELASGEDVYLECQIPIYGISDMKWVNRMKYMDFDSNDTSTKYSKRSRIRIQNATTEDGGTYECVILKGDDVETISKTIIVIQTVKPKIKDLSIKAAGFELQCFAYGYPAPNISWFINDKHMENITRHSKTFVVEWSEGEKYLVLSSLNIPSLADGEEKFSCVAENKAGADRRNINVSDELSTVQFHLGFVGLVVIFLLLLITVTSVFYIKIRRARNQIRELKEAGLANFEDGDLDGINPELNLNEQADLLPYDQRFEFPLESLSLKEQLGAGAFGVVTKAIASGIIASEAETTVAVKTIDKEADNATMKALISELKIMIHIGQHLNIVSLLGAVTKNVAKRELFVIIEFCSLGSLEHYLRKHRQSFDNLIQNDEINLAGRSVTKPIRHYVNLENVGETSNVSNSFDTSNLLSWALQVARGMDYLTSKKVFHGDLAARNVLLSENDVVKICDFGLAKYLNKNYFYTRTKQTLLPFKWLALESIEHQIFNIFSDVWAYGN